MPPTESKMKRKVRELRRDYGGYFFVLPTFVLLATFNMIPFIWAIALSFFSYDVGGEMKFIGFANYLEYFSDPTFVASFRNMLFITGFGVLVNVVFPLTFAKLIFSLSSERARYVYRVIFLFPILVPGVAILLIWQTVIYGEAGLLNQTLQAVTGDANAAVGWLSNPRTVLWAIVCMGFPWASGIYILIYYAGLSGIPESVHEAALLDGCTGLRKFFSVDIPLVLSQIKLIVILALIGGIQGFEGIYILTEGGPGFKSMVPGLWMYYNAFSFQRMGYASAIGVILFLLILTLTTLNLKYFKTSEELQGTQR